MWTFASRELKIQSVVDKLPSKSCASSNRLNFDAFLIDARWSGVLKEKTSFGIVDGAPFSNTLAPNRAVSVLFAFSYTHLANTETSPVITVECLISGYLG